MMYTLPQNNGNFKKLAFLLGKSVGFWHVCQMKGYGLTLELVTHFFITISICISMNYASIFILALLKYAYNYVKTTLEYKLNVKT